MKILTRRKAFKTAGLATLGFIAYLSVFSNQKPSDAKFEYCLNTSTIKGQNQGLLRSLEIASRAGYDSVELLIFSI